MAWSGRVDDPMGMMNLMAVKQYNAWYLLHLCPAALPDTKMPESPVSHAKRGQRRSCAVMMSHADCREVQCTERTRQGQN